MNIAHKKKIVLLGMMCRHPVAGVVWQTVHYLVGLQRLGYDPYYVEAHGGNVSMFTSAQDEDGSAKAAAFTDRVMRRFELGADHWCFQALHASGRCYGLSEAQLRDLYGSAALVINLHGATRPRPEHTKAGPLVYLETDPVAVQIELYQKNRETVELLEPHAAFFTFGENYGRTDCRLPVSPRFHFKPTRQPVVMDFWQGPQPQAEPLGHFTTVGNWEQQWREVKYRGEVYHWSKHLEFLKFVDLPTLTAQTFELALSSCDDESTATLEAKGWRVRRALDLSHDLDEYRQYLIGSRGEFTVAKDQNVRLRSGWFSDRSAAYLAAGRPVITQETGFSNVFPTGQGLFGFTEMHEVLDAVDAINASYECHSRAASQLAREHFNYDVVLEPLLRHLGL